MENVKTNNKTYTILKIIWGIIVVALTAWLVWELIDIVNKTDDTSKGIELAVYLILMVIIFGIIGYGISALIGLVGAVVAFINFKKGLTTKGKLANVIIFYEMTTSSSTFFCRGFSHYMAFSDLPCNFPIRNFLTGVIFFYTRESRYALDVPVGRIDTHRCQRKRHP